MCSALSPCKVFDCSAQQSASFLTNSCDEPTDKVKRCLNVCGLTSGSLISAVVQQRRRTSRNPAKRGMLSKDEQTTGSRATIEGDGGWAPLEAEIARANRTVDSRGNRDSTGKRWEQAERHKDTWTTVAQPTLETE